MMRAFGVSHILWLSGIAATAIIMCQLVRRQLIPQRFARIGLALFMVCGELQRYFQDGMKWPDRLPFNLCNMTTWVAVFACLTMAPWAAEFVYFTGLAGAGMALLTPDMGAEWPARFFMNHGSLMVTAAVLVFGRMVRLRPGAMWRSYAIFVGYVGFAGTLDRLLDTNYAYLRRKPAVSVLTFMGPWPVYILFAFLLALVLFSMLWLIAPGRTAKSEAGAPAPVVPPVLLAEGRENFGHPESSV